MPRSSSVEYLGRVAEAELDDEVRGLLSFDDCPSILRASRLATLMRQLGKVIKSSNGSAQTYQMSIPVDRIQIFLSHNWSVPRGKKFLCLAVHFNWLPAIIVTSIVLTLAAVLTARGYFPVQARFSELEGWKDPAWREGFVCSAISFPVFLLVVLFWRDLLWIIGWRDIPAFLDKTCIHQEDQQIMRMGIERLGAFLMRSEQMLALYTDTYLTKLWTTYEVASFLTLHGADNMRVLPVRHAVVLLLSQAGCWFFSVAIAITHELLADYKIIYVAGMVLAGFLIRDLRGWELEKIVLENRVRYFRVQECTCAVENDRAIVYENISRLMRASGTVGRHASQDEALEAFNKRVRNELMGAFRISLGRHTFRFRHYLTMGWSLSGGRFLDMLVSLHLGLAPRYIVCNGLFTATWVFGLWIVVFLLVEKLASLNLHLRGPNAVLWVWSAALIVIIFVIAFSTFFRFVRHWAETSDLWLGISSFLMVLATVVAMTWIFGWHRRWCCRSEKLVPNLEISSSEEGQTVPDAAGVTATLSSIPEHAGEESLDKLGASKWNVIVDEEEKVVEDYVGVGFSEEEKQIRSESERRHRNIQSI